MTLSELESFMPLMMIAMLIMMMCFMAWCSR